MRIRHAVWAAVFVLACPAHGQESSAMRYYDQIQAVRDKAGNLVDAGHPDVEKLQKAESLLKGALDTLARPEVMELADGSPYLLGRRYDTLRDLAGVFALEGRKEDALDALDAMQAEAWIPDVAALLRKDPEFASLREEPRFKAMLATLDTNEGLWNAKAIAVPYAPRLDEAERIAGLSLFWSEVKYNFAHFDHVPDLDWNQTYLQFLPRVIAAKDTTAYYEVLMRLAPLLHDGHTNIYPPAALEDHFYARPPMRTELVQGRVLVTRVLSPSLEREGIHVGDEVLQIDGMEVHRYARDRVAPYESSDTPQDADVRDYDYALLAGDAAKLLHLRLKNASGIVNDVEVARGNYHDVRARPAFVIRTLPGNVVYLSLDNFESNAAVKAFEQHLPEIMKAKGLILDVRDNGGGSGIYGQQILSYLSENPIPTEQSRELQISPVSRARGNLMLDWRKLPDSGEPFVKRRSVHFQGPVAVLIGPRTFSAAEDFVVSFDAMKRGILVGQRTAGSTGQPLFFELPGGGSARICVKRDAYPDGSEFVGNGIAPDIEVVSTIADVRADRDSAVITAAHALLGEKPAGPQRP